MAFAQEVWAEFGMADWITVIHNCI